MRTMLVMMMMTLAACGSAGGSGDVAETRTYTGTWTRVGSVRGTTTVAGQVSIGPGTPPSQIASLWSGCDVLAGSTTSGNTTLNPGAGTTCGEVQNGQGTLVLTSGAVVESEGRVTIHLGGTSTYLDASFASHDESCTMTFTGQ